MLFAEVPMSSAAEPPNVLFIAIDYLRPALGCYGDPLAKSPNIDQFAKSARRFSRAYVQQAVCGPSRTALLTGLLPDHTRVWYNRNRFRETRPNHVTLPQLFKQNGYRTLSLGKIYERQLGVANRLLSGHQIPKLAVSYADAISDAKQVATQVAEFLGNGTDVTALEAAIDPDLYRQRREELPLNGDS